MKEVEIDLNKCHDYLLNLLKVFDKVCRENKLSYSLAYGTCLGAIRHKGFIPWDDDVDVYMPREDYQKLIEVFKDDERYQLYDIYKNDNYFYPFAKLFDTHTIFHPSYYAKGEPTNIYIDIFPLDNCKESFKRTEIADLKLKTFRMACYRCNYRDSFRKIVVDSFLDMVHGKHRYGKVKVMMNKILKKYHGNGEHIANMLWIFTKDMYVFKKSDFDYDNLIDVPFEDSKFKLIANYDEYLTTTYGNYMKPPSEHVKNHRHYQKMYEFVEEDSDKEETKNETINNEEQVSITEE